ncbi:hypothetical protein MMC13_000326 [Lambiella insularis]|nr:hypothetical protein [Lambiella insularis]
MPSFSYAKLAAFQYQTFDQKTVQFTNIPVWTPPEPPPVEQVVEPEIVPPEAPNYASEEENIGDDPTNDGGGVPVEPSSDQAALDAPAETPAEPASEDPAPIEVAEQGTAQESADAAPPTEDGPALEEASAEFTPPEVQPQSDTPGVVEALIGEPEVGSLQPLEPPLVEPSSDEPSLPEAAADEPEQGVSQLPATDAEQSDVVNAEPVEAVVESTPTPEATTEAPTADAAASKTVTFEADTAPAAQDKLPEKNKANKSRKLKPAKTPSSKDKSDKSSSKEKPAAKEKADPVPSKEKPGKSSIKKKEKSKNGKNSSPPEAPPPAPEVPQEEPAAPSETPASESATATTPEKAPEAVKQPSDGVAEPLVEPDPSATAVDEVALVDEPAPDPVATEPVASEVADPGSLELSEVVAVEASAADPSVSLSSAPETTKSIAPTAPTEEDKAEAENPVDSSDPPPPPPPATEEAANEATADKSLNEETPAAVSEDTNSPEAEKVVESAQEPAADAPNAKPPVAADNGDETDLTLTGMTHETEQTETTINNDPVKSGPLTTIENPVSPDEGAIAAGIVSEQPNETEEATPTVNLLDLSKMDSDVPASGIEEPTPVVEPVPSETAVITEGNGVVDGQSTLAVVPTDNPVPGAFPDEPVGEPPVVDITSASEIPAEGAPAEGSALKEDDTAVVASTAELAAVEKEAPASAPEPVTEIEPQAIELTRDAVDIVEEPKDPVQESESKPAAEITDSSVPEAGPPQEPVETLDPLKVVATNPEPAVEATEIGTREAPPPELPTEMNEALIISTTEDKPSEIPAETVEDLSPPPAAPDPSSISDPVIIDATPIDALAPLSPPPSPNSEKRHRRRTGWERERRYSKSSSVKSGDAPPSERPERKRRESDTRSKRSSTMRSVDTEAWERPKSSHHRSQSYKEPVVGESARSSRPKLQRTQTDSKLSFLATLGKAVGIVERPGIEARRSSHRKELVREKGERELTPEEDEAKRAKREERRKEREQEREREREKVKVEAIAAAEKEKVRIEEEKSRRLRREERRKQKAREDIEDRERSEARKIRRERREEETRGTEREDRGKERERPVGKRRESDREKERERPEGRRRESARESARERAKSPQPAARIRNAAVEGLKKLLAY